MPNWNYEVVHAQGTITVHDDERFVRRLVAKLTHHYEAAEPRPWKMGDSAPEYITTMLGNIVGIEITITALQSKVKLSQNRETRNAKRATAWAPLTSWASAEKAPWGRPGARRAER